MGIVGVSSILLIRQHNADAYHDAAFSQFVTDIVAIKTEQAFTPEPRDSAFCRYMQSLADGDVPPLASSDVPSKAKTLVAAVCGP